MGRRTAQVNRSSEGDVLGTAVFLDAEDLAALGVDVDGADELRYEIEDGQITLQTLEPVIA